MPEGFFSATIRLYNKAPSHPVHSNITKKITNILKLQQNPRQWMAPPPQHGADIISCVAACTRWGLELFGIPLPYRVRWQDLALLLLLSPMVPPLGVSSRV